MFVIKGRRGGNHRVTVVKQEGPLSAPLPLRLNWVNHSPTGFDWGYHGSGPSQLALAILGEVTSKDRALEHCYKFKVQVVAQLPFQGWALDEIEIRNWLKRQGEGGYLPEASTKPLNGHLVAPGRLWESRSSSGGE